MKHQFISATPSVNVHRSMNWRNIWTTPWSSTISSECCLQEWKDSCFINGKSSLSFCLYNTSSSTPHYLHTCSLHQEIHFHFPREPAEVGLHGSAAARSCGEVQGERPGTKKPLSQTIEYNQNAWKRHREWRWTLWSDFHIKQVKQHLSIFNCSIVFCLGNMKFIFTSIKHQRLK